MGVASGVWEKCLGVEVIGVVVLCVNGMHRMAQARVLGNSSRLGFGEGTVYLGSSPAFQEMLCLKLEVCLSLKVVHASHDSGNSLCSCFFQLEKTSLLPGALP